MRVTALAGGVGGARFLRGLTRHIDERDLTVVVKAPCCHSLHTISTTVSGFESWRAGQLIQFAMPELDDDQRELLISGYCPDCWTNLFNPNTEDLDHA